MAVAEVERNWRTPAGLVFRVRTTSGCRFTLTYDEVADRWDVQPAPGTSEGVIGFPCARFE